MLVALIWKTPSDLFAPADKCFRLRLISTTDKTFAGFHSDFSIISYKTCPCQAYKRSTRASLEYDSILAIVDFDGEGGGENDSGDLN